jgi:alpha-beta hydrolase superfamily lysophospholipase
MLQLDWNPDILPGFEQATFQGVPDSKGPLDVTLIRRRSALSRGASVLYVHGFIDYFFQSHLADFYIGRDLDFYAIDLRRHGRSLRPGQLPNFTANIEEYLCDIDDAVRLLREQEQTRWLLLNGHSTGGLAAALYAHRGQRREQIDGLFLNSPFLDMNLPVWQARFIEPLLSWSGSLFPYLRYPGLSPVYAQSVHARHRGQWLFRTDWKPINGFPVYAGWFRAIHRAQAEVAKGLDIKCPCLVLHAENSFRTSQWSDAAQSSDIVLNIEDIKRLSPSLGMKVEVHAITEGMHDLVLSNARARERVWALLGNWLDSIPSP